MVRESIAPVVCRKEASLVALATEDQFRGDSLWYKYVTANSKEYTMLSTIYDPAIPTEITDVLRDMGYVKK